MKFIEIKNFKNLDGLKIDSLARVNLLVGKNNVGKSTLLEAISIFLAKGSIDHIKEILDIRGEGVDFSSREEKIAEKEIERFVSLYKNRDLKAFLNRPVEFKATVNEGGVESEADLSIRIVQLEEKIEKDEDGIERTIRKVVDNEVDHLESNLTYGMFSSFKGKASLYLFGRKWAPRPVSEKMVPFEYVRTSQIASQRSPALFDKIALSPLEDEIIRALQIIEPRINALNFLKDQETLSYGSYRDREDNRIPIVVLSGSSQRYRLSSMGDGINRILTIILALLNCKDGVLLLDEVENGLHYSVQLQLWQIIFDLSDRLNIQVFATTHSNDCIKSFIEADRTNNGRLIRLEQRGDSVVAVSYNDSERLSFAVDHDIEIR